MQAAAHAPATAADTDGPALHAPSLGLTILIRRDGFRWRTDSHDAAGVFSAQLLDQR